MPKAAAVEKAPTEQEPQSAFERMAQAGDGNTGEGSALAVPEAPAIPATQWSETPQFQADEIGFPQLRMAQGLTAEVQSGEARPGQWLMTGSGALDAVTVVPIMFARTRDRTEEINGSLVTLCQSPDAVHGYGNPGIECDTCPFAQWTPDEKSGKNKPPACTKNFNFVVYVAEYDTLAQVTFKRTSQRAATTINQLILRLGMKNFAVQLSSQQMRNGQRVYSMPLVRTTVMAPELRQRMLAVVGGGASDDPYDNADVDGEWLDEAPVETED